MKKRKLFCAIIPARKNSSRLKNKNFKLFNGKPLIYWTIILALKCRYIEKILVTSDSEKILKYCSKFNNITLSKRPKNLSTKSSKIEDVITYEIRKNYLSEFEYFILLQPTSPLRTIKTLNSSIKLMLKKKVSSCISFYKIKNNFGNLYKIINKKILKYNNLINNSFKNNFFIPSGDIYISNIKNFIKYKKFINKNTIPYIVENRYSDIDYLHEFKLAEKIHKLEIK